MRSFALVAVPLLTATIPVFSAPIDTSYGPGLVAALNTRGFTALANFASIMLNSTYGPAFLATVSGGKNTLLAPSNGALVAAQNNSGLATPWILDTLLSYHLLTGQYNEDSFAAFPNHTVAQSYLTNATYVNLPGGKAQAVVFSRVNGTNQVLGGQPTPINVTTTFQYQDLTIHQIDHLLRLPPPYNQSLQQNGLNELSAALTNTSLTTALEAARGITIFAPEDEAFAAVASVVSGLTPDTVANVLKNHVINGTVAYSTLLGKQRFISSGGTPFQFFSNATGSYVTSGSSTAKFVNSDLLFEGGVIHILDQVLLNGQNDPQAADAAYSSYMAEATGGSSTSAVPTSAAVPTTSAAVPTTTASMPITTAVAPTTTVAVPATTPVTVITTTIAKATSKPATTTTKPATTTHTTSAHVTVETITTTIVTTASVQ